VTTCAGAFLIAYIVMIFLIGMPLLLLEFSFGQYFSTGSLTIFRKVCPIFQGTPNINCTKTMLPNFCGFSVHDAVAEDLNECRLYSIALFLYPNISSCYVSLFSCICVIL